MKDKEYCYVQFKYECEIKEEEEIRIVGNKEELGNWDLNKAEPLFLSNINVWKSRENIELPINNTVEYKYVIFKNNIFLKNGKNFQIMKIGKFL